MTTKQLISKIALPGLILAGFLLLVTLSSGLANSHLALVGGTTQNMPFIARNRAVGPGIVTGTVTDAVTGETLEEIEICFPHGDRCVMSDQNGVYTFTDIPSGYRKFETEPPNYASLIRSIDVLAGTTNILNFVLSVDDLVDGQYRIVLTWDADPKDLDAHLWPPYLVDGRPHVFQENRGNCDPANPPLTKACLDKDSRNGFGPETITILEGTEAGTYHYAVQRYEPGCWDEVNQVPINCPTDLQGSKASVQVYDFAGCL